MNILVPLGLALIMSICFSGVIYFLHNVYKEESKRINDIINEHKNRK